MSDHRLLLVPSFTELEWGIREELEQWAEVATFDAPGVGEEKLPTGFEPDPHRHAELLARWRAASIKRGLGELDDRGWSDFVVVGDDYGAVTAVGIAVRRRESVTGLALGHASLSHATVGDRAPVNRSIWEAMAQLARQGREEFVRYGIAQATRGGVSDEVAEQMVERFPDMQLVSAMIEALGENPEPIGDDLAALDVPLLFAQHVGCLGRTEAGFEDAVNAFPEAKTVGCPESCSASPAFAAALREFCEYVRRGGRR